MYRNLLTYYVCNNIWSDNLFVYRKTCFPRKTWVLFILLKCYFERMCIIKVDSVEH